MVGDRWGSVAQLVDSIGTTAAHDKAHFHAKRDRGGNDNDKCFVCGGSGHFARDCPQQRQQSAGGGGGGGGGGGPEGRGGRGAGGGHGGRGQNNNDVGDGRKRGREVGEDDEDIARAEHGRGGRSSYLGEVGSAGQPKMRMPSGGGDLRGGARRGAGDGGGRGAGGDRGGGGRGGGGRGGGFSERDRELLATASRAANAFSSDGSFMDQFKDKEAPGGGVGEGGGGGERKAFGWTPGEMSEGWGKPSDGRVSHSLFRFLVRRRKA